MSGEKSGGSGEKGILESVSKNGNMYMAGNIKKAAIKGVYFFIFI